MDDEGYANNKELALLVLIGDGNHRPTRSLKEVSSLACSEPRNRKQQICSLLRPAMCATLNSMRLPGTPMCATPNYMWRSTCGTEWLAAPRITGWSRALAPRVEVSCWQC
jgi:hypothetical protein